MHLTLYRRDVREVEAELVAYLTAAALGKTENLAYSRGYIQSWNVANAVEKVRFGKVFATADAILKAGRIEPERPDGLPDPNPPENGLAL